MLNLNDFMNNGIKNIADTAGRFYAGSRQGQAFLLKLLSSTRAAAKKREKQERGGVHIPPFLIASIAAGCNLRCTGCYAWANGGCGGEDAAEELGLPDWRRIFGEAYELGVSFILLAGGEPLMRRDIIELAAEYENIIFPIFTNGTMIDEEYLTLFDRHRNLIPVLSIEGDEARTDKRRGRGVSRKIADTAAWLQEKGILYGVSVTVTSENQGAVTDSKFVRDLREHGCGLVFFVEYVPAEAGTEHLALQDEELQQLQAGIRSLRDDRQNRGMILLSFPGDEEMMGGCLAAGRGFFHVNAAGGAEPCPFSPHSEMNLKRQSILEVLQSPFFGKVREISMAQALQHKGGCTLFQFEDEVKNSIGGTAV